MIRHRNESGRVRLGAKQRRRSMTFAAIGAIYALIGYTCLGEKVLSLAALKLGAGEFVLGVLNFMMVGTWFFRVFMMNSIERYGKKRVLIFWKSISAVCIIPFLFIPVIAGSWPGRWCLGVLLGAAFIRSATYALGNAGWFPLLQDIVPSRVTGRFFANVRVAWQTARVLSLLSVAWFFGREAAWWKFGVVFGVGLAAYVIRIVMIVPMTESPKVRGVYEGISIRQRFLEAFGESKIRYLVFYMTSLLVVALVAEPFKIKYLKDLGYSDGFVLAGVAMIGVGAIVSLRFWGRIADRFGNIPVFNISHIGLPIANILWIFVGSRSEVLVFVLFFVWSVFFAGNGIAMTRYTLHIVPYDNQNQINIVFVVSNFFAGLAPVIVGLVLEGTSGFGAGIGGIFINNYHVFFVISALLYIFPIVLRRKLSGTKDSGTIEVVATVLRPVTNMFGPFLHAGSKEDSSGQKGPKSP